MIKEYSGVYVKYLRLLASLIGNLSEQTAGDNRFLSARLSPDMFPLGVQARTAAAFGLRACCFENSRQMEILNGVDPYDSDDLVCHLNRVADHIESLDYPVPELIEDRAGVKDIRMPVIEYINCFSLPNFFFHTSMVYAIARQAGFKLTKGDFDGIHEYPAGFSWEQ